MAYSFFDEDEVKYRSLEDVKRRYEINSNNGICDALRDNKVIEGIGFSSLASYFGNIKSFDLEHIDEFSNFFEYIVTCMKNNISIRLGRLDSKSVLIFVKYIESNYPDFFNSNNSIYHLIKLFFTNEEALVCLAEIFGKNNVEKQISTIKDPYLYNDFLRVAQSIGLDMGSLNDKRKEFIEQQFRRYKEKDTTLFEEYTRLDDFDYGYYYGEAFGDDLERLINFFFANYMSQIIFGDDYININNLNGLNEYNDIHYQIDELLQFARDNEFPIDSDTYTKFTRLAEQSIDYIIELYQEYKDSNVREQLSMDLMNAQIKTHEMLLDSCTDFSKESNLFNQDLSDKYGITVYYLDGEEFHSFVRSDVQISKDLPITDELIHKVGRLGTSFTFIGTEKTRTYKNPSQYLTLFYRIKDSNAIKHVYKNDSWSGNTTYTDMLHTLSSPTSLLNVGEEYPEILIDEFDKVEPIGIMVNDEVTEWDAELARRTNLPLMVINTKKYSIDANINNRTK